MTSQQSCRRCGEKIIENKGQYWEVEVTGWKDDEGKSYTEFYCKGCYPR